VQNIDFLCRRSEAAAGKFNFLTACYGRAEMTVHARLRYCEQDCQPSRSRHASLVLLSTRMKQRIGPIGEVFCGTPKTKVSTAPALAAREHGRRFSHIDPLVLVGGAPSATKSLFTFPVARDCYERSIPKACNKRVVRTVTANVTFTCGCGIGLRSCKGTEPARSFERASGDRYNS
jgi:hypothetical protein